jgi:hypothetical protein
MLFFSLLRRKKARRVAPVAISRRRNRVQSQAPVIEIRPLDSGATNVQRE